MASSKIKGITIEIDGDTTKLGKALESAEGSSKSLQSELKGINTLLKLDPSNVELLTQKQQVLTDAISSTEDKLQTLKTAQAQVQAQFEKGDITAEQYRDFQREIVATEKRLESLKNEAKEFGSVFEQQVKAASEKVKELGGKVEEAGKKMGGLSAGAAAGLGVAITSAASLEEAINKYIGATGKSIGETEKYKEVLQSIHDNNYGEDYADIADKMRIVSNILGDLPADELQNVVEKSYMLEDAYDMDFQENIRGVNALMDQFGISSEQAYELINQGAQKGLNQNQDLTDQIAEYSTYYAKLGFTAEDFFNMMVAGAQDGAYQIDYLNDAMKEFGIRTKDNSKSTNEAYGALGLDVDRINNLFAQGGDKAQEAFAEVTKAIMAVEDPVKRNEIGVALFGTKFEDLEENAVFAMTSAKDSVNMLGSTVEETSETMYGGTSNKAQEAARSIQSAFASLGETLLPIIAPIAEKIAELAAKFSELSPTVQKIILVVAGLVAAAAPILIVVGKIITAIGTLMPIIGAIATFVTGTLVPAIGTVVTALGWPVIAIAAIIGAIVLLWNKCEWFRDAVMVVWEAIKTGFGIALDWIIQKFQSAWEAIKVVWNFVKPYFQLIWENIKIIFSVVKDVLGAYFKSAWEAIKAVWNVVTGYFKAIWNTIKGVFAVVKAVLSGNWKDAWNAIKSIVGGWVGYFKTIWNSIKQIFSAVGSFFSSAFKSAWEGVKKAFSNFKSFFSGLWDGIKNTFSGLGTKIGNAISGSVKTAINGVIGMIEKRINGVIGLINGAIGLINEIPGVSISKMKTLSFPRLATGTNYVPEDEMPAILHKGEQVVPKKYNPEVNDKHLKNAVFDALTSFTNTKMQNGSSKNEIGELTRLMKQYMPLVIENMGQDIVLDDRTLVGKIAPKIDKQLGVIAANKNRGY